MNCFCEKIRQKFPKFTQKTIYRNFQKIHIFHDLFFLYKYNTVIILKEVSKNTKQNLENDVIERIIKKDLTILKQIILFV